MTFNLMEHVLICICWQFRYSYSESSPIFHKVGFPQPMYYINCPSETELTLAYVYFLKIILINVNKHS